jgi:phospholipid transport system substrate-binding protein
MALAGTSFGVGPLQTLKDQMAQITQAQRDLAASSTDANRDQLLVAVKGTFDFDRLARESLGDDWADASPSVRREYLEFFGSVVEQSTLRKLEIFEVGQTEYQAPVHDSSGASITTLTSSGEGDEIAVLYMLHKTPDGWRVYDMVIGTFEEIDPEFDVSTSQNYRDAFHRIVVDEGWESLLRTLRDRHAKNQE